MEKWAAFISDQNDLQCFIYEADNQKSDEFLFSTKFYLQRIKSRLIISNFFPEVIAAPMENRKNYIVIIMREEFFKSSNLQLMLKELNLTFNKKDNISHHFENCLYYTIEYKMAPDWIKIGNYFVNNMNFTSTKDLDAIKLSSYARTFEESFQAVTLKLPLYNFNDLKCLIPSVQEEFLNNGYAKIDYQLRYRILPRLTLGTVLSVSKQIPPSSPFKNYEDLRKHWKDMYGYKLPPTEKDIFYFEVVFSCYPTAFVYPNICMMKTELQEDMNSETVVSKFLNDLSEKVPTMFGKQLKLSGGKISQSLSSKRYTQSLTSKDVKLFIKNIEKNNLGSTSNVEFSRNQILEDLKNPIFKPLSKIRRINDTDFSTNVKNNINIVFNNNQQNIKNFAYHDKEYFSFHKSSTKLNLKKLIRPTQLNGNISKVQQMYFTADRLNLRSVVNDQETTSKYFG